MEVIRYTPVDDRTPDSQYRDILENIMDNGEVIRPIQGGTAKRVIGAQLQYDMSNGFPLINERKITEKMFIGALAEHVAFLNGARTLEQLSSYGVPENFWGPWVTAEKCAVFGLDAGDLGDGSYGAAWADFPTTEGAPFDQVEHLMRQMRDMPYLRTHVLTSWIPQYALQHEELRRKVVVAPCHGIVHVLTNPQEQTLNVHHIQRSGDMPVGVPFNIIQYAAFGMMVSKILGYRFDRYIHTFSDAHIYEEQFPKVEELLQKQPRTLATVAFTDDAAGIENIKDFRPHHFTVSDYDPHAFMSMPTPI